MVRRLTKSGSNLTRKENKMETIIGNSLVVILVFLLGFAVGVIILLSIARSKNK